MEITLTTPGLLFPAVSLLLLAYTNRFLALASLIRSLHTTYRSTKDPLIIEQIETLRYRVTLIQRMQATGVLSLLVCVLCMFVLFSGQIVAGKILFGAALVLLMTSLALSVREIQLSVKALNLHLGDIEQLDRHNR